MPGIVRELLIVAQTRDMRTWPGRRSVKCSGASRAYLVRGAVIALCSLACGMIVWPAGRAHAQASTDAVYTEQVRPLLETYCFDCHTDEGAEADLRLEPFTTVAELRDGRATWLKVLAQLQLQHMPPADADQPTAEERKMLVEWIDRTINTVDCSGPVSPGRVTLRRLNRHEYRNTIRDLLGIDFEPAEDFPADDVGYGFDNIGDVLSLPPLLMEKYLAAAEEISRRVMATPESRQRVLVVAPNESTSEEEAAEQIIAHVASAAYRRPATAQEIERLASLARVAREQDDGFEAGVQLALQAILVSPHFLFRVELDPEGDAEVRTLNDFELATRLSYFLWSSMPDEELSGLAREGQLRQGDQLDRQVRRMLADPKAQALIENFAGQWLQLRSLEDMTFDPQKFAGCDRKLLLAMREETMRFFATVVREDLSVLRILDADFTFVNELLARHYGLAGVEGEAFRRVSLQGTPRSGILTQGSVLAVTSNPTRTSPVKRGKFVLDNLLGAPPPPAPANVPMLDDAARQLTGTLRQRMEQHRSDPTCAACHQLMDPLGFALEQFDAVGRFRTEDGGEPIDTAGELPSGERFSGLDELRALLLETKRADFSRCLAEKTLVYALGRGLEYYDQCAVQKITKALEQDEYRFSRLVLEVVKSEPFQKRAKKRSP